MKYVLMLLGLMMSLGVSLATLHPFCCYPPPDNYLDCEPLYDVTYDPPLESESPLIIICHENDHDTLPLIAGTPPYNVTTREIMIDGVKGTIMNVSRFSNVDDAIRAQKELDPTFPWEYTIDEIKNEWTKFDIFDGKMLDMGTIS